MDSKPQVHGKPIDNLPEDLYIPTDALEIVLESFAGPLDLLLYLIKRQNIDILQIPIAQISQQYMQYINLMKEFQFEIASEYLQMAAWLAEIKSRMLLPHDTELEEEEDPRAELAKRLQQYEIYQQAGEQLEALPRQNRDLFLTQLQTPPINMEKPWEKILLDDLVASYKIILQRLQQRKNYRIQHRQLSVSDRMNSIMSALAHDHLVSFYNLLQVEEGSPGVVVTFIALLELVKRSSIEIKQSEPYSIIMLKRQ